MIQYIFLRACTSDSKKYFNGSSRRHCNMVDDGSVGHFTFRTNFLANSGPLDRSAVSGDKAEPELKITRWNSKPDTKRKKKHIWNYISSNIFHWKSCSRSADVYNMKTSLKNDQKLLSWTKTPVILKKEGKITTFLCDTSQENHAYSCGNGAPFLKCEIRNFGGFIFILLALAYSIRYLAFTFFDCEHLQRFTQRFIACLHI